MWPNQRRQMTNAELRSINIHEHQQFLLNKIQEVTVSRVKVYEFPQHRNNKGSFLQ